MLAAGDRNKGDEGVMIKLLTRTYLHMTFARKKLVLCIVITEIIHHLLKRMKNGAQILFLFRNTYLRDEGKMSDLSGWSH